MERRGRTPQEHDRAPTREPTVIAVPECASTGLPGALVDVPGGHFARCSFARQALAGACDCSRCICLDARADYDCGRLRIEARRSALDQRDGRQPLCASPAATDFQLAAVAQLVPGDEALLHGDSGQSRPFLVLRQVGECERLEERVEVELDRLDAQRQRDGQLAV
jgi:hypothetical protein